MGEYTILSLKMGEYTIVVSLKMGEYAVTSLDAT